MKFHMISAKGKEFLEKRENRKRFAYPDSGGAWSIGIGHLLTKSEKMSGKIKIGSEFVKYLNGLTNEQIDVLFSQDIAKHEGVVSLAIHESDYKNWQQIHIDALVSFCFNIGVNAFKNSTLSKFIKSGDLDKIPWQMKRWIYDNGQEIPGLINRRTFEVSLFENGIYA